MSREPVIANEGQRDWETWADDQVEARGVVFWKTLISRDLTDSEALALGVARVPVGARLNRHRHEQPEAYLVLDGRGELTVDDTTRQVTAGDAIFIPGGATHSTACAGPTDLRFAYVFPADSSTDVDYDFGA
jgi:quercetin dioxygenase-like cupin family protein